ncbi:hypothetical protein RRG08_005305 [Elysia crispata]|uniref:Uncharacterized protein n=1 Tax=Elysia crispata TaxID=231223 RepID=A0AAE1A393_9GAST|nr:hypothetical protein RRG08_005305 [Elysia crispata]
MVHALKSSGSPCLQAAATMTHALSHNGPCLIHNVPCLSTQPQNSGLHGLATMALALATMAHALSSSHQWQHVLATIAHALPATTLAHVLPATMASCLMLQWLIP